MKPRSAICVVVDGLRAGALGSYGNTIYPTPAIDRFASTASVFERVICSEPTNKSFYDHAWAHGGATNVSGNEAALLPTLAQKGVHTTVFTDDALVASYAQEASASQVVSIERASETSATALDDTDIARLFLNAAESISASESEGDSGPPSQQLVWVHSQSLTTCWDAPAQLRQALLEDEGSHPFSGVLPPQELSPEDDPDVLLSYREAYAAQVSVLDECIAALVDACHSLHSGTLLILASPRGFSLGEHQHGRSSVHNECLHVPCIAGVCNASQPGARIAGLRTPAVVASLLENWFLDSPREQLLRAERDPLTSRSGTWRSIRTGQWTLIEPLDHVPSESEVHLYASPDDRWELNNVAQRCPEVVATLRESIPASTQC